MLGRDDPQAQRDVHAARWRSFIEPPTKSVEKSKMLVWRDYRASWEGYAGEAMELRTWIHALLRAFGRCARACVLLEVFHGVNRRTTYATELKMQLMQKMPLSSDGAYTDDMIQIYHDAARLRYIMNCVNLADVDFVSMGAFTLEDAREARHTDAADSRISPRCAQSPPIPVACWLQGER